MNDEATRLLDAVKDLVRARAAGHMRTELVRRIQVGEPLGARLNSGAALETAYGDVAGILRNIASMLETYNQEVSDVES